MGPVNAFLSLAFSTERFNWAVHTYKNKQIYEYGFMFS